MRESDPFEINVFFSNFFITQVTYCKCYCVSCFYRHKFADSISPVKNLMSKLLNMKHLSVDHRKITPYRNNAILIERDVVLLNC